MATLCYVLYADINECEADTHNCHDNAECSNTDGNYTCECARGYDGDGRISCDGKFATS